MHFSERGIKTTNEVFDTEESACQFIFEQFCVESLREKTNGKYLKILYLEKEIIYLHLHTWKTY